MTEQSSKLPRKPFGYDPSVVDQMLADRDSMLALAERRVREAEGKAARLEAALAGRESTLDELSQKLADFQEREAQPQPEPEPQEKPLTPGFMSEELSKVISAAEESTSQILSRARASTRDQIMEADRLWREVHSEVVRFAGWREQAERSASAVQTAMKQARAQIEAVPERIQDALSAAVEAMVSVDSRMAAFDSASALPLLATPSGMEEARARVDGSSEPTPPAPDELEFAPPHIEVDMAAGPSEDDWPSLVSPALGNGAVGAGPSDPMVDEASQELARFQSSTKDPQVPAGEDSAVWGN
jgi:hypothetical protein